MGFPNLGDYAQNNGLGGEEGVGLILALPHLFTSTTHFGALLFQRPKATLGQFGMAKKSAGTHMSAQGSKLVGLEAACLNLTEVEFLQLAVKSGFP